jgi:hypothetical protein
MNVIVLRTKLHGPYYKESVKENHRYGGAGGGGVRHGIMRTPQKDEAKEEIRDLKRSLN